MSITKKILKEYFQSGPVEEGIFGIKVKSRTYKDYVLIYILDVLMNQNGISEKAFALIDDAQESLQAWADDHADEFDEIVSKFEATGHRKEFCGEYCYGKFFKDNNILETDGELLMEKKKSEFDRLEDNKVPLTDEERKKVMDAEAVWHHGPGGAPSPAVWKSVNPKTKKTTFVTHTHRAYNTAPTLKGAISRYHSFINKDFGETTEQILKYIKTILTVK